MIFEGNREISSVMALLPTFCLRGASRPMTTSAAAFRLRDKILWDTDLDKKPSELEIKQKKLPPNTPTLGNLCFSQCYQMAKLDPFLSLDCAGVEGVGEQSKKRKGSNFAAQRSGAIVQKPEGPNTYDLKIWL